MESRIHSSTLVFVLLSLFTTKQRAAEIEGDLIEESACRGRSWFAVNAAGTALALFAASLMQAPLRVLALSAAATGLSCGLCRMIQGVFFPGAFALAPLFGLLAVVACAFLIGCGLSYVAPHMGVRAAAATTIILTLLFVVWRILASATQFTADLDSDVGNAIPGVLTSPILILGGLIFSTTIFLVPLLAGAVWTSNRRCTPA